MLRFAIGLSTESLLGDVLEQEFRNHYELIEFEIRPVLKRQRPLFVEGLRSESKALAYLAQSEISAQVYFGVVSGLAAYGQPEGVAWTDFAALINLDGKEEEVTYRCINPLSVQRQLTECRYLLQSPRQSYENLSLWVRECCTAKALPPPRT